MLADAAAKLIRKDLKALKDLPEGMTFTVTTTGRKHVTVIVGGVHQHWLYEWVQYGRHSVGSWETSMEALGWIVTVSLAAQAYRKVIMETEDLTTYSYTCTVAYDYKIRKPELESAA